jgi:hypothetical protein
MQGEAHQQKPIFQSVPSIKSSETEDKRIFEEKIS